MPVEWSFKLNVQATSKEYPADPKAAVLRVKQQRRPACLWSGLCANPVQPRQTGLSSASWGGQGLQVHPHIFDSVLLCSARSPLLFRAQKSKIPTDCRYPEIRPKIRQVAAPLTSDSQHAPLGTRPAPLASRAVAPIPHFPWWVSTRRSVEFSRRSATASSTTCAERAKHPRMVETVGRGVVSESRAIATTPGVQCCD